MKGICYLTLAVMSGLSSLAIAAPATLAPLSDREMAAETGQALFNMSYIAPGSGNPNTDIGFYKVGMEAQLDINANIKKFQLGCGGFRGVGCDVDIDNLSFTGIVPTRNKPGGNDAGPQSDFVLNNPFFEIAIKSPQSAAQREVVGFKIGADSAWGILSIGDPGPNPDQVSSHIGINSITGHLPTIINNGIVPTTLCLFAVNASGTGCSGGAISSTDSTINVDTPNPGDNRFDLTLSRASRVALNGIKVKSLLNLTIDSNLDQSLKFIHSIASGTDANNNGVYDAGDTAAKNFGISVQGQDLRWNTNGQWLIANKGWWMELPEGRIEGFTTRRVYATLGAVAGLNLKDLNQNQYPVDNCYGGLTFC